jgi:hypothetical protein
MAIDVPRRRDPATDAPRRDTTFYDRNSRNDESADAIIERSLAEVQQEQDQQVQQDHI